MIDSLNLESSWLLPWMRDHDVQVWGVADLSRFLDPADGQGEGLPFGISFAIAMNPTVMSQISEGPNQAYADEYAKVNVRINMLTGELAKEIKARGLRARPLDASNRTDLVNIKGDFPHKTAATLAGLGWIGRHCQLITRRFGPWVRLGTIFTDMKVPLGKPEERAFCGRCKRCVEACPAGALTGESWYPGRPRHEILDVWACDRWKKDHFYRYHEGHNCGICSAVCPYGRKLLSRKSCGTR